MMNPTIYEAEIVDPATAEPHVVRASSPVDLETAIDQRFGVLTDAEGRELVSS